MITRYITESEFKIGFDDRFNIETNDWVGRLNKWLLKSIRLVNSNILFQPSALKLPFSGGILHMPIDIDILYGITYEGIRLSTTDMVRPGEEPDSFLYLAGNAVGTEILVDPNEIPIGIELPKSLSTVTPAKKFFYTVMRDDVISINVGVPAGEVIIYYKSLPYTIANGKLEMLIPDDEFLIDNLEWYVLLRLMGRGYKHHVFTYNDANTMYSESRRHARESVEAMSLDQREMASRHFRQFITDYSQWHRLGNYES